MTTRRRAARVTLLGLFLDVYGDRAVWPRSVRRKYAAAVILLRLRGAK